jgi:hypothetical protein
VKHLAFYVGNAIDLGVEIFPMKATQEQTSSGPGYSEGALYDVARPPAPIGVGITHRNPLPNAPLPRLGAPPRAPARRGAGKGRGRR